MKILLYTHWLLKFVSGQYSSLVNLKIKSKNKKEQKYFLNELELEYIIYESSSNSNTVIFEIDSTRLHP